jgi:ribosomal protein S18 acetylase RimI-like enzyme
MRDALQHGLATQWVLDQLRRAGIGLSPYFLFREGVQSETEWPELAREFPSSVLEAGNSADVAAMGDFDSWRTVERIRARLGKGDLCVMLKNQGRIAGFTWADLDEINDSACDYELGSGEAYLYDAFIAPEYRGRGLAAYMRAESYKHLRGTGRHTFYSLSDCFNTPAIKFKQKLNAEITRLYLQIKLGKRVLGQWQLRNYDPGH